MPQGFIEMRPLLVAPLDVALGFRALVSHDIEGARAYVRGHRHEPRRGYERDGCVLDTFSPSFAHRLRAEFEILRVALGFVGAIDQLDDVHRGDAAKLLKEPRLP